MATVTLGFSAPVVGVDAADFTLTRTAGGTTTTLTGFTVTGSGAQRTIGNLTALTATLGTYTLRLRAAGSGIATPGGTALGADAVTSWVVQSGPATPPEATLTQVAPPSTGAAIDAVAVTFSTPVTGVTLNAFRLFRNGAAVSLSGVVLTGSGNSYQIRGLAPITALAGAYELRLVAAGAGIKDADGIAVASNAACAASLIARPAPTTPASFAYRDKQAGQSAQASKGASAARPEAFPEPSAIGAGRAQAISPQPQGLRSSCGSRGPAMRLPTAPRMRLQHSRNKASFRCVERVL